MKVRFLVLVVCCLATLVGGYAAGRFTMYLEQGTSRSDLMRYQTQWAEGAEKQRLLKERLTQLTFQADELRGELYKSQQEHERQLARERQVALNNQIALKQEHEIELTVSERAHLARQKSLIVSKRLESERKIRRLLGD